jgi:hypothetical protein
MLDGLVRLAYPTTTFVYVLLVLALAYHLCALFRTGSWPNVTITGMLKLPRRMAFHLPVWKGAEKVLNGTVNFLMNISVIYDLLIIIALLVLFLALTDAFAAKTEKPF